jgi:hypothetical protein
MATQTATPVRAGRGIALAAILTSQLMMVLVPPRGYR